MSASQKLPAGSTKGRDLRCHSVAEDMKRLSNILLLFFLTVPVLAQPYLDPGRSVSERVDDLLSRMTLEEKIGQMTQVNFTLYNSTGRQDKVDLIPEKFIPLVRDHKIGSFLNGVAATPEVWERYSRQLQELNLKHSRLKIPLIYGMDHVHGTNYVTGGTIFPQPLNLAATFNDKWGREMGRVTAREAADLGHHWIFAPILDLAVNPYWPRVYETFGEEPLLAQRMGSAFIEAVETEPTIAPYKLAATAKHYLGYSGSDSGWDRTPAQIPQQYLYEFFVPAFRSAVDAGVDTVMINSAEINGTPTHANPRLLNQLLRKELGFEGVAVTDWEDILYLVSRHRVAHNEKEATRMAIEAGVDMSMTALTTTFPAVLKELVQEGAISEERIDKSVRRILSLKFRLGLFENPFPRAERFERIGSPEHRKMAQAAAEESLVLLKNKGRLLPLKREVKLAVVGPNAFTKRDVSGGWTLNHQGGREEDYPARVKTVAHALKVEFPNLVKAEEADVVVAVVGEHPYAEGSGNIQDLTLPEEQLEVLKSAFSYGKPVVIVHMSGRPRLLGGFDEMADGFLWAGLPGFEGAPAIAGVLSGRINPSGRLPFSYPSAPGHFLPYHHKPQEKSTAAYPFGHGLSYTSFAASALEMSENTASVTITNTGKVPGRHSVLWFLQDEVGRITRPVKRLRDYQSIWLNPGQSETLEYTITSRDLGYPDREGKLVLEEGWHTLSVEGQKIRIFQRDGRVIRTDKGKAL